MDRARQVSSGITRGRDVFKKNKWFVTAVSYVLKMMPTGIRLLLWNWSDFWPGYAGVGMRYALLKGLCKDIGDNIFVGEHVKINGWDALRIGNNVSIHNGCYIDATGGIAIGNDVSIAHQSSILSSEHTWDDDTIPIRDNPVKLASVEIRDDVWIGCGCRILSGVTVNSRAVVGAGSVVTHDVPSGSVIAGVPARVIKRI